MNSVLQAKSATDALAQLRQVFESAVALLASRCAVDGHLDGRRVDERQVASFDLVWASAELLAAESVLRVLTDCDATELDRRLALTYAVEAIGSVISRLEGVFLEFDCSAPELQMLATSTDLRDLRLAICNGASLQQTGNALADCDGEIGRVDLGEELLMVQNQFRRFAADVVAPLAERIHRLDLTVPEALLTPLREMGLFGLSIPEEYGGVATGDLDSNMTMIVATEALSEASLAAAGSLITRPEILARALITGGTEEQKRKWLPRIALGDPLCAIAITEPDFGSDVASLSLRATRAQGGWHLDGAKTWCTFAGKAGLIMVVARTDPDRSLGHRGLSALLAEKPVYEGHDFEYEQGTGGRLTGRAIPTIGYRGMHSFDLSFQNFFVPDANVIGGEKGLGRGFYFTMSGMIGGRLQTAARASGVMRAAFRAALRYARQRKVFGSPLVSYQLTGAKLAKMAARLAASRQLAYSVGRLPSIGGAHTEASLVKLFACRSAEMITREALQIFGGIGYAEETSVSRYFVDARVLSIFEGAEEILALKVIVKGLLEQYLERQKAA